MNRLIFRTNLAAGAAPTRLAPGEIAVQNDTGKAARIWVGDTAGTPQEKFKSAAYIYSMCEYSHRSGFKVISGDQMTAGALLQNRQVTFTFATPLPNGDYAIAITPLQAVNVRTLGHNANGLTLYGTNTVNVAYPPDCTFTVLIHS